MSTQSSIAESFTVPTVTPLHERGEDQGCAEAAIPELSITGTEPIPENSTFNSTGSSFTAKLLSDIENCKLGTCAAADAAASSELNSYDAIPLENLTDEQVFRISENGDFEMLHARSKEIGAQVMKFIRFFERFKPIVVAMKAKFGPRRGSHARMEVEPGVKVTWAEYCERYYGVSYRWVEKLIDGDYVSVPNEDAAQAAHTANQEASAEDPPTAIEKKPTKKDKVIARLQKQVDDLKATDSRARKEQQELVNSIHTPGALWAAMNKSGAWIDALDNVFMVDSEEEFATRLREFSQRIADGFQKGFTVEVRFVGTEEGGE